MNSFTHQSKLFLKKNGSTILTCVGGAGVVVTSVMAVKATPKAMRLLEAAKEEKGEDLTKLETVKVAGPAYIPSVLVGMGTVACVFGANMLNKRQQASLMSAYALLDSSYKEYKDKVKALYGPDANDQVTESIAKDKYEETDVSDTEGKQLFYDSFSGQYFESTIEKVLNAEYFLNRDLSMRDWAVVNEWYEYLDIPPIDGGDDLGWSAGMNFDYYWQSWIDFGHNKITMEDGRECTVISMFSEPSLGWEDY